MPFLLDEDLNPAVAEIGRSARREDPRRHEEEVFLKRVNPLEVAGKLTDSGEEVLCRKPDLS